MPAKQEQRAEINTFVQGLITEASPLNFPPNASADEENFELNRDGSRNRRLGMDVEFEGEFRSTGIAADSLPDAGITSFKWTEVAGNPELEFLVLQFNRKIVFYDLNKNNLSSTGYLGEITLNEFPDNVKYSFSSVEGILVAVSGVDTFAVISYDNGAFNYYLDRLKIRDMFGVQETNPLYESDMSYRGPIDTPHYYNLQNQSWGIPRRAKVDYTYQVTELVRYPNPGYDPDFPADPDNPRYIYRLELVTKTGTAEVFADPIAAYLQAYGFSPSNGEAVWLGMQYTPGQYNGQTNQMDDPYEQMFTKLYKEAWGSEVKTARGYYIIDALRRGQSRVEQMQHNKNKYPEINVYPLGGSPVIPSFTLPVDYTTGGASCVSEFAGRMFFSGFTGEVIGGDLRSPNYSNYVFFSTMVRNKLDLGRCYQDGDPTGRETPDILDTDGGFLRISEAKDIHTLVNVGTSLIVIARNGVWRVDGGSDYGFSATNYRVEKISTFGGISSNTVALENNRVYYWADDGIYTIGRNELGDMTVESISLTTIQSAYEAIPNLAKEKATALYDNISKKVRWVFNEGNILSESNVTKEIVLDTSLGAFSINRIMNRTPNDINVISLFQSAPYVTGRVEEPIYVGDEEVFAGTELVTQIITTIISSAQSTKYLAVRRIGGEIEYTFSLYNNIRFSDWESIDGVGVDAKAYCLTGSQVVGDSAVKKQIPYLVMHFTKTEETVDINFVPINQSSCKFRCQWNFASSIVSHKWTPLMQAYRYRMPFLATQALGTYDNGFEVVTTKNKVRGMGHAFALYFETEPRKDCRILGWNITMTGNSIT